MLGVGTHPLPGDPRPEMDRLTLVVPNDRPIGTRCYGWLRSHSRGAGRRMAGVDDLGRRRRRGWRLGAAAAAGTVARLVLEEELVERHVELVDDRVEGADGRRGAPELDLGDQAGRHADAACQLTQTDVLSLALGAQTLTDTSGPCGTVSGTLGGRVGVGLVVARGRSHTAIPSRLADPLLTVKQRSTGLQGCRIECVLQ